MSTESEWLDGKILLKIEWFNNHYSNQTQSMGLVARKAISSATASTDDSGSDGDLDITIVPSPKADVGDTEVENEEDAEPYESTKAMGAADREFKPRLKSERTTDVRVFVKKDDYTLAHMHGHVSTVRDIYFSAHRHPIEGTVTVWR